METSAASQAAEILAEIFAPVEHGLTFRLWDGSELRVGRTVHPLTVTFNSPRAFKRVLFTPTAAEFGEAYCDGDLEFDGDLFMAMSVADSIDEIDVPFLQRVRVALRIWRIPG